MYNANYLFTPGKLTTVLDGGAGSSGKAKLGSYICEHADNWQFACNTFSPNAGHTVVLDDGRRYFYQTLNSCAYLVDKYEKLYIGPGAIIELPALFREIEENKIPTTKLGISPITAILQDIDGGFERGTHDFDGNQIDSTSPGIVAGGYLAKTGTTAHGVGACRARRVLRRPEAKYARDIHELQKYLCDVPLEIMGRLDQGQSGLFEIAQGFQLSYLLPEFAPFTTSRNCTVAAGLDDMMLPPCYAGNVIINFRTYPIRINNNKYIDETTGGHMTWAEVTERAKAAGGDILDPLRQTTAHGKAIIDASNKAYLSALKIKVVEGNSGPGYPDQKEISWDELTKRSGSPTPLMEMTSVTKLPRRVFTFSQQNVEQAIRHNQTGGMCYLSINFMNYADHEMCGVRGQTNKSLTPKALQWIKDNISIESGRRIIEFIGTGPRTDDMVVLAAKSI